MMLPRFLTVLVFGLCLGADGPTDAVKKEQEKLQGTWQVVAVEMGGEQLPEEAVKEVSLVIKGEKMTAKGDFPDKDRYATVLFKIDPAAKPKQIDLTLAGSEDKGTKLKGIYQLDGDRWKLCVKLAGTERPTKFETKDDAEQILVTFKRDKS
jgi:uncharacterized protein (TIGR03067 family)